MSERYEDAEDQINREKEWAEIERRITKAQQRMLDLLRKASAREPARFPNDGGWVDFCHDVGDPWSRRVSLPLLGNPAEATWRALMERGLVQEHPEHRGLVRPA